MWRLAGGTAHLIITHAQISRVAFSGVHFVRQAFDHLAAMSVSPTTSGCSEDENTTTEGASTEGGVMSVNSAIDDYIKMAKKRKTIITRKQAKKSATTEAKESEQLMLAIGRMYHCFNRGRGILKRGNPPVNIIFNKHCSYQHMLERCVNTLKYDKDSELEFYLADTKGVPIWIKDTISIDEEAGEREIPWTLINYIHYSNVKYPSKARIYCVEKVKDSDTSNDLSDNSAIPTANDGVPATPTAINPPTANDGVSAIPANDMISATEMTQSVQQEIVITTDEEHDGQSNIEFKPLFLLAKKSLYRDALSTRITGQCDVLRSLPDWNEADYARADGHQLSIFPDNPCHHGFPLTGIDTPDSEQIELVETYNDDGTVILKKPLSTGLMKHT